MALPRKHSRQITVAGITYRWCLGKLTYTSGLGMGDRVVVQAADQPGARLVVSLHPFWCDEPSLTPRHVADFIEDAIGSGWQPLEPGPPFEIRHGMPRQWT
jgi:hypothetical protein